MELMQQTITLKDLFLFVPLLSGIIIVYNRLTVRLKETEMKVEVLEQTQEALNHALHAYQRKFEETNEKILNKLETIQKDFLLGISEVKESLAGKSDKK